VTELAIGDTGASVCCSGLPLLRKLGASAKHLLPTSLELKAANGGSLQVLGAVTVLIKAGSKHDKETRELLYVVKDLKSTFVSKDALVELGIIGKKFSQSS